MKPSLGWGASILWLLLVWTVLIYLLEPSGSSMRAVWDSSETYAHGYVILPITLWLVWRKRLEVGATPIKPDYWALLPAFALCALWLAGSVAGAQVVEHYALVGLLIVSVWAQLGRAMMLTLLFPLLYLLLMVPAGDSLIEPMIHFTADFTVHAIRLFGIPVMQEGTFFVLPTGEWSVVEACSGIRYFLSSIVLGWLFAYLTYRTWWKRVAFGAAAIVVPVIANGFRATIIVLLGHYSGMTLAVGVDHLIYGWLWFGIVMLLMFWVGNIWREDTDAPDLTANMTPLSPPPPAIFVSLLLVVLVAIFPYYERHLSAAPAIPSPLATCKPAPGWRDAEKPLVDWQPRWLGMDDKLMRTVQKGDASVMLFVAWYGAQRQGSELINYKNVLVVERDPAWRNIFETDKTISLDGTALPLRQAKLQAPSLGQRLLVWHWRHIDGENGSNDFRGKLRLAVSKLAGRGNAASGVLIAAPYKENPEEAETVLKSFLRDNLPLLNQMLDTNNSVP